MPHATIRNLPYRICASAAARLGRLSARTEQRRLALQFQQLGLADNLPTWTSRSELEALYYLARGCPPRANIVEVGSYLGASTAFLAAGAWDRKPRIFCIDTWTNETITGDERDTFAEFRRNIAPAAHMIEIVRKRSETSVPAISDFPSISRSSTPIIPTKPPVPTRDFSCR